MMRQRWRKGAGHVARMGKKRNARRVLVMKPEGKIYLKYLVIDDSIILKCLK
jgi:hypothetical protein